MDARTLIRTIPVLLASILTAVHALDCCGAQFRTPNFVVSAKTPELAQEIGVAAERLRKELAVEWIGKEMPNWSRPCPIVANVSPDLGAGGATSFVFDRGHVFGWKMDIQGSRERVLDSVLPHEITHTVFACHFRKPLPRWADEGACTTVEHPSEIKKQEKLLIRHLRTRRGIPFSDMFAMKEYPQDVLPLYSQGHSLARFLIGKRGKQQFLDFLRDGMEDENWPRAVRDHYGDPNLLALQNRWLDWVKSGRPEPRPSVSTLAASSAPTASGVVYRGQSPDAMGPSAHEVPSGQAARPRAA